ncbi:unnamed protein product, partial [Rotaria socialis]
MHEEGRNKLNISTIILVVTLFTQGIYLIGSIGPCLQALAEAQVAIKETNGTEDNETKVWKDSDNENATVNLNGDIRFDSVTFEYPTRHHTTVLQNLTFVARAGETTALVGSSGSGKSTCMSLLLRLYEPSSGNITINGKSISDCNVKKLRQSIGVVNQEPILFDTTIYENILYGNKNATRAQIEEAAREANAHNFIMQLTEKYDTLVGERSIQLSGGEKQRVALARTLVKQPVLLLLDEATSALDNINEKNVQETLSRACKNRTTIVIAHRLAAVRHADCIYVLDKGKIVESGTYKTLMSQEGSKYREMVQVQQLETIENDDDIRWNQEQLKDENEKQT